MDEEQTKEWMKEHYSDLADFDNLQFVKDCAEEGKEQILKDKEGFWINAITKELCYRQRIIGKIKIEDGYIAVSK